MIEKFSNTTFSNLIIQILDKYQIYDICICPGSRNTPLKLAFLNHNFADSDKYFIIKKLTTNLSHNGYADYTEI